jgi:CHAT domain-containing protein/tetratricopeptide (TPR) repeat protein
MAEVATKDVGAGMRASSQSAEPGLPADLLPLAHSTPTRALSEARELLASGPDDLTASYAHQAAGIVLRDRGDLPAALQELRAAIRSAKRTAISDREADVRATLGATLVMAGRTRQGLAELNGAADQARGGLLARIRLRRAHVLSVVGRHGEALVDLQRALAGARREGDVLWEARILNNRCLVHIAVGALSRADADAEAASRLFEEIGQALESVQAFHNGAIVASRRGDLPAALRLLDTAERRYRALGVFEPELIIDRGQALLAAGLATEALESAENALAEGLMQPVKRAELLLFAAKAALATEEWERARERAGGAIRLFRAQRRPTWEARARLMSCQSRYFSGDRSARLLATVLHLAAQLAELHADEAPLAHLLAGRLADDRGDTELATANLAAAAAARHRGPPLTRATGWLAVALRAASTRGERGLLTACRRGLDALDEHRLVFGAAELRAVATSHGRELATLAIDAALRRGSPRSMLDWTERWRATSLAEPSVRPPDDRELLGELAALRDAVRRLDEMSAADVAAAVVVRQRDQWEAAVRSRRLHLSGSFGLPQRLDVDELLSSLGEARLVVLVEANGVLHALTAGDGRIRRHEVGSLAAATREVDFARFALRRAAYRRGSRTAGLAEQLQTALLGPLARNLDGGPVIVVPPSSLHSAPWSLLPALSDLPVSVSPSASMWLRANATLAQPPADRRISLVVGPRLDTGGSEVPILAALYPSATVLGAESTANVPATVESVLASMNGAEIAHIAAHGRFRADSPLFSSLELDEGPLFVHDLDRLHRAPRRVVLSACDTGVSAPVGADELLGLVSGLLRIGAAGVLASVVPVNDEAAAPFMVSVHQALATGKSMPEAALDGRRVAAADPLSAATAASFTVWGA